MLYDRLNNDLKQAMKNHDKQRLSTLRMLKSAIIYQTRANEKIDEVSDDIVIDACSKQVKTHNENITLYEKSNRLDLSEGLKKEIEVISEYLPKQLTLEEINKEIDNIFEIVKPQSKKDMGLIMKEVNTKLKGKADMKVISTIVQDKLNSL